MQIIIVASFTEWSYRMPDEISERNLARYKVDFFRYRVKPFSESTPFCLSQVIAYEPESPESQQKKAELLDSRIERQTGRAIESVCGIGGCSLRTTMDLDRGRTVTGRCKAADYCLKASFEAVGQAPTVEQGKVLYREIINNLEGHTSAYGAGNFCPNLSCGLSAGVSIDMVPGTAGTCQKEITSDQQSFSFD